MAVKNSRLIKALGDLKFVGVPTSQYKSEIFPCILLVSEWSNVLKLGSLLQAHIGCLQALERKILVIVIVIFFGFLVITFPGSNSMLPGIGEKDLKEIV